MESDLSGLGYEVDRWQIDVKEIANMPGFSPVIGNYENAVNVVAAYAAGPAADAA